MKNLLFIILSLTCISASAKKVMFTVDMSTQIKSANGIHIWGDFQSVAGFGADFTPNTCLMIQDVSDTNIYHFTVDIPAFVKYDYKFINGDQGYEVEVLPIECQVGYNFDDNRWIYVDSLNTDTLKLPAFVFGANCAQGMNMIRFKVDMTSQTSTSDGIHVAGNFQGNDPTTTRLYSFGNNVYEIIAYMADSSTYTYKYYYGNTSSTVETVPSACAVAGDRSLALNIDTVLPKVCFSSCGTCYPSMLSSSEVSSLILYPNPMQTSIQIHFNDQSTFHHVVVLDQQGRQVQKVLNVVGNVYQLQRNQLTSGYYILSVMNDAGIKTNHKLIVE